MRSATITIDTNALSHNLRQVKKLVPKAKVLAMVKANAYGHGVANSLLGFKNADGLGVAFLQEALEVRALGWHKTLVLIEGVFSLQEWQHAINNNCQCVIHNANQVAWAVNYPPNNNAQSNTIWLKLNTGMNRLGFAPSAIIETAKHLHNAGYKIILTSHFANADDASHPLNTYQLETFYAVLKQIRNEVDGSIEASLSNSAGIINFNQNLENWVRPGIMLYGSSPVIDKTASQLLLKPAMMFTARLIAIDDIAPGESVGYGSLFTAIKPTRKGIISVGYGDGYPRVIANSWVNILNNQHNYKCPIIGRVAMDMIAIDLTRVATPKIGDTVTLWGDPTTGAPHVDEIANCANTISYELFCRLSNRPNRLVD